MAQAAAPGPVVAIGWACGASTDILQSLAPKSATMPIAMGLTAHGIGTAYAFQVSELAGASAALAMGLNGMATRLLLPLMVQLAGSRF